MMEQHLALLIVLVGLSVQSEDCQRDIIDYITFLQQDLEPSLSLLLDGVLNDIKEAREAQNVARTFLRPLMKTREVITKRLNRIRRHKLPLCYNEATSQQNGLIEFRNKINSLFEIFLKKTVSRVDKLKQLTKSLIQLKRDINNEVMRIITTPESNEIPNNEDECKECNNLESIIAVLGNIILCNQSENTVIYNNITCLSPKEIEDELHNVSDYIDETVENILTKVMSAKEVNENKTSLKSLKGYNDIRSSIDEFLRFLTSNEGRRINQFSIERLSNDALNKLKKMQKTCFPQCIPYKGIYCGLRIIKSILEELTLYKDLLNTEGLHANKHIREELVEFLDTLDNQKRNLQIEQIWSKTPDQCREHTVKYLKIGSDDIWPLVNLTLQNQIEVNKTDCWYETQHLCGGNQEQNRYNSYQQLTSRRGLMSRWRRQATPHRGTNRVPVDRKCPQLTFRQSSKECSGLSSNCWRPGTSDPDCLNNGLCCFDGCADKCLNGPNPTAVPPHDGPDDLNPTDVAHYDGADDPDGSHPDIDCQTISLRKCRNVPIITLEIEDKINYFQKLEENILHTETKLEEKQIKSCEETEYDQTKKYIETIDDIIKKSKKESDDQRLFQLGLVDILTMFDNRVSLLFVEELCCYEEVDVIKGKFMPLLLICMDELMIDLDVTRLPTCVKNLRMEIFSRNNFLLDKVIKQGFNKTRSCPCQCKKSAREGICLEECEIYSDDFQCCPSNLTTLEPETMTTALVPEMTTTLEPEITTLFGPEITTTLVPELTTTLESEITTTLVPELTTLLGPEIITTLGQETESHAKPDGFITTITTLSTDNVTDNTGFVAVTDISTINPVADDISITPVTDNTSHKPVTDNSNTVPVTDDLIITQVTDDIGITVVTDYISTTVSTRRPSGPNCPSQCRLPSGIPWTFCPTECSRWSGDNSGVCCSPSCPAKCSPVRPDIQCLSDGVRECNNIPGCCPDKYDALFGDVYFDNSQSLI